MTVNRSVHEGPPGSGGTHERQAALPEPLWELHRWVLSGFTMLAGPPPPSAVAAMASDLNLDLHQALEALAAADLIHTDPGSGAISVAYPYSGRPTPHRVQLDDGTQVWAMCALDALGIPQMTRRDARIRSTDPTSDQPVTAEVQSGAWRFEPATTAVLVATAADRGRGSFATCCSHINFHTDPTQALTYLQAHPDIRGEVLDQADAVEMARHYFGSLLDLQRRQVTDDNQTRRSECDGTCQTPR
jgi:hypothetical protein